MNINNYDSHKKSTMVLIDTWWNVNYIQQSKILNSNKVLIDTWWNVNTNKLGAGVEAVEF